jgi:pimeloyl-ACP methyl ester carboxylesterase
MKLRFLKEELFRRLRLGATTGWAITREAGASVLTYELYPLGFAGASVPALPTIWIRRPTSRPPVLFIHGVLHNGSAFTWLKQNLALYGWRDFKEMNLLTTVHSIPAMAEQTAQHVHALLRKHSVPQIDIVAHSMGGIIARYFVQMLGGDGMVRHLVTLGTPHLGTEISRYAFLPHLRELAPDSQTIRNLRAQPTPQITQGVSISGNLDLFMWPRNCVWWEGVRNIHLRGVGHAGLLFSRRVLQILVAHLNQPAAVESCPLPSYPSTRVPALAPA